LRRLCSAIGYGASECPLWVKSRHRSRFGQCLLYPQKRTSVERVGMSALCHKQTHAPLLCHSLDGAGTLTTLRVMGPYAPA
jgi:hypothetical protein